MSIQGPAAMRIYQHSTLVKIFYTIYVGIIHIFEAEIRSEPMTYLVVKMEVEILLCGI